MYVMPHFSQYKFESILFDTSGAAHETNTTFEEKTEKSKTDLHLHNMYMALDKIEPDVLKILAQEKVGFTCGRNGFEPSLLDIINEMKFHIYQFYLHAPTHYGNKYDTDKQKFTQEKVMDFAKLIRFLVERQTNQPDVLNDNLEITPLLNFFNLPEIDDSVYMNPTCVYIKTLQLSNEISQALKTGSFYAQKPVKPNSKESKAIAKMKNMFYHFDLALKDTRKRMSKNDDKHVFDMEATYLRVLAKDIKLIDPNNPVVISTADQTEALERLTKLANKLSGHENPILKNLGVAVFIAAIAAIILFVIIPVVPAFSGTYATTLAQIASSVGGETIIPAMSAGAAILGGTMFALNRQQGLSKAVSEVVDDTVINTKLTV